MGSRMNEHLASRDRGLPRASTVSKPDRPAPIHPAFADRTSTSLGGPTQGAPPDASSPLPTDPSRQGKSFPIPAASWNMRGGDGQDVDLTAAHRVMAGAERHSDDFARDLHTELPESTNEES